MKIENKSRHEIVELARKKHGEKYTYSKVRGKYYNGDDEIIVCCPTHGDYRTTVQHHVLSNVSGGCPKCENASTRRGQKRVDRSRTILRGVALDHLIADGILEPYCDHVTDNQLD